jgi:putative transposase
MHQIDLSPQDIALRRYDIISPLLQEELEPAEYMRRRREILADGQISDRTLCRYLQQYRQQGFEGLLSRRRSDAGTVRAVSAGVIAEAIDLKGELPRRSADIIITTLENEGVIKQGKLRPSTLRRHLRQHHLQSPGNAPTKGIRRFEREHRNSLWQVDVKHGLWLKDPKTGKNVRTQLLAFIDDNSRLVPFAQFYLNARLPILEDGFRQAVAHRGLPDTIYVDQGKIFMSKWFRTACAKLKVRHMAAKPFSPESKGKIERFMLTVEIFLEEMKLEKPQTLEELNQKFFLWLDEYYHRKPHLALGGKTPAERFDGDTRPLRLVSLEELKDAFLWEAERKVDKTGCFKYCGQLYDVGPKLARHKILIRFDPFDDETVEVWDAGKMLGLAKKLVYNQPRTVDLFPETTPNPPVQTPAKELQTNKKSRLMMTLEKQNKERTHRKFGAISYRNILKAEEEKHV